RRQGLSFQIQSPPSPSFSFSFFLGWIVPGVVYNEMGYRGVPGIGGATVSALHGAKSVLAIARRGGPTLHFPIVPSSRRFSSTGFICCHGGFVVSADIALRQINAIR
ncbi:MAG: hypothetical protein ACRD98_03605, partial [Nitrososphaera sp.]